MNRKEIFRDTSKKMIGCLIFGCMATFISMGFLQAQSLGLECQKTPERVEEYINYLSSIKVKNNESRDKIEELLEDFITYKLKVEKLKKPLALRGGQPGQVVFDQNHMNDTATHRDSTRRNVESEDSETKRKCKADEGDKCERLKLEIEGNEILIRRLQRYIDDLENRNSKAYRGLNSQQVVKSPSNERKCRKDDDECRSLEIDIALNTMNIKNFGKDIDNIQQRISGKRNELESLSVE